MILNLKRPPHVLARAALRRLTLPVAGTARELAGAILSVETRRPAVALTFDDGPSPEVTPQVLDILRHHGARATFFLVGENAQAQIELLPSMVEQGHAIANHTWSHLSLPLLNAAERWAELRACQGLLGLNGAPLFRPPYGQQSWHSRWQTLSLGYEVVAFNVHAEDWLAREADWMAARLIERTRPGSIIILHDNIYRNILPYGQLDRRPMLAALDLALRELRRRFEFVTVPELLRLGRAVRANWYNRCPPELQLALRQHISDVKCRLENRKLKLENVADDWRIGADAGCGRK